MFSQDFGANTHIEPGFWACLRHEQGPQGSTLQKLRKWATQEMGIPQQHLLNRKITEKHLISSTHYSDTRLQAKHKCKFLDLFILLVFIRNYFKISKIRPSSPADFLS